MTTFAINFIAVCVIFIWASWCVQNLDGVKVDIKDI